MAVLAVLAVSRLAEDFEFVCVTSAGLRGLHMGLSLDKDDEESYQLSAALRGLRQGSHGHPVGIESLSRP